MSAYKFITVPSLSRPIEKTGFMASWILLLLNSENNLSLYTYWESENLAFAVVEIEKSCDDASVAREANLTNLNVLSGYFLSVLFVFM